MSSKGRTNVVEVDNIEAAGGVKESGTEQTPKGCVSPQSTTPDIVEMSRSARRDQMHAQALNGREWNSQFVETGRLQRQSVPRSSEELRSDPQCSEVVSTEATWPPGGRGRQGLVSTGGGPVL